MVILSSSIRSCSSSSLIIATKNLFVYEFFVSCPHIDINAFLHFELLVASNLSVVLWLKCSLLHATSQLAGTPHVSTNLPIQYLVQIYNLPYVEALFSIPKFDHLNHLHDVFLEVDVAVVQMSEEVSMLGITTTTT